MSIKLLEELEGILKETNCLKQSLNVNCSRISDLLYPAGSKDNGSFTTKKHIMHETISSPTSVVNIPSTAPGSLEKVDELIALGKLLRNKVSLENKRSKLYSVDNSTELSRHGYNNKEFLKPELQDKKSKSLVKDSSTKKYFANDDNVKIVSEKKNITNIATKTNKERDLSGMEGCGSGNTNNENTVGDKNCGDVDINEDCTKSCKTENSASVPMYSHICSPSLSIFLKTLKMPEKLHYLLKQYYSYENSKLKCYSMERSLNEGPLHFKERFSRLVKLKLDNDLKTNMKHTERYKKYLNFAEEVTESQKGEFGTKLEYSSVKELKLYEEKCHHLLELRIQMRILDVIGNFPPV